MLNWIEFDSADEMVIEYRLTALGEIALGIQDTATEPAPASAATGEQVFVESVRHSLFELGISFTEIYPTGDNAAIQVEAFGNLDSHLARLREYGYTVTGQHETIEGATGAYLRISAFAPPQPATRTPGAESETIDTIDQMALAQETIDTLTAQLAAATSELVSKAREVDTMQDSLDDTEHMVNEARAERDSLKARVAECQHAHELASTQRDAATELYSGKHSRLEDVKRELEVSRDARKALEKVIQTAATYLAETNSNDENVGRAYNVLQGFSTPDTD